MAIKALEHEPSNGDLIWRNDAIDALAYFDEKSPTGRTAQQVVMGLPTAQHEIVRCEECANYDTDWTPETFPDRHYCFVMDGMMPKDGFCNYAERR